MAQNLGLLTQTSLAAEEVVTVRADGIAPLIGAVWSFKGGENLLPSVTLSQADNVSLFQVDGASTAVATLSNSQTFAAQQFNVATLSQAAYNPETSGDAALYTIGGGAVQPTFAISGAQSHRGLNSIQISWAAGSGSGLGDGVTGPLITGLIIGQTYTASCWIYNQSGNPNAFLSVPGGHLGNNVGGTATWTQSKVTFTASTTDLTMGVFMVSSLTGTSTWIDDFRLDYGSSPLGGLDNSIQATVTNVSGGSTLIVLPNNSNLAQIQDYAAPVVAGNSYTSMVLAFQSGNTSLVTGSARISWYDVSGTLLSSSAGTSGSVTNTGTLLQVLGVTAPTNAVWAVPSFLSAVASTNGDTVWMDNWGVFPDTTNVWSPSLKPPQVSAGASLGLVAAASAKGQSPATGAVALVASATAKVNAIASGVLSLVGTATGSTTATGVLGLTATGTPSTTATGLLALVAQAVPSTTATGLLALVAAAAAKAQVPGTGAVSLVAVATPSTTATGLVSLVGSGTGQQSLGGTGVLGLVAASGDQASAIASALVSLSGSGTGSTTATGLLSLLAAATGSTTAAGLMSLVAQATTSTTATGSIALVAAATDKSSDSGTAALSLVGLVNFQITANGILTLTAASGVTATDTASAVVSLVGSGAWTDSAAAALSLVAAGAWFEGGAAGLTLIAASGDSSRASGQAVLDLFSVAPVVGGQTFFPIMIALL